MECGEINLEVCPVAEDEEEERGVDRAAICEIEAAEALAGLARYRTSGGRAAEAAVGTFCHPSQGRPMDQQIHDHTSSVTPRSETIHSFVENVQTQLCSTNGQPKSMGKSRQKLTETEKEQQKLRRILANRESARETIRRRKAMYQELSKKAADVLQENEILKKEKELAVAEYNSLKDRNKFLKAQRDRIKKTDLGEIPKAPTTTSSQTPCPANQPHVYPCFWPSIFLPSEVVQFQSASGSNVMCSPQFPMLQTGVAGLHQGQENIGEINRGAAPIFVVGVPMFVPCLAQTSPVDLQSGSSNAQNPDTTNQYINTGSHDSVDNAAACHARPAEETLRPRNSQSDDPSHASTRPGFVQQNQEPTGVCPLQKAEDSLAATEARRRRKELLKLKNILQYSAG